MVIPVGTVASCGEAPLIIRLMLLIAIIACILCEDYLLRDALEQDFNWIVKGLIILLMIGTILLAGIIL